MGFKLDEIICQQDSLNAAYDFLFHPRNHIDVKEMIKQRDYANLAHMYMNAILAEHLFYQEINLDDNSDLYELFFKIHSLRHSIEKAIGKSQPVPPFPIDISEPFNLDIWKKDKVAFEDGFHDLSDSNSDQVRIYVLKLLGAYKLIFHYTMHTELQFKIDYLLDSFNNIKEFSSPEVGRISIAYHTAIEFLATVNHLWKKYKNK